jgi:hypothetical protein
MVGEPQGGFEPRKTPPAMTLDESPESVSHTAVEPRATVSRAGGECFVAVLNSDVDVVGGSSKGGKGRQCP